MRKNKRKLFKNRKKKLNILELPIKTAAFFLILFAIVFQQETRDLSTFIIHPYRPEIKLISGFKSFVDLFNNIVSYFKGIY